MMGWKMESSLFGTLLFNPLPPPFLPSIPVDGNSRDACVRFGKLGHVLYRGTSSTVSPKIVINLRGRDKGEMNKGGEQAKFLIIPRRMARIEVSRESSLFLNFPARLFRSVIAREKLAKVLAPSMLLPCQDARAF